MTDTVTIRRATPADRAGLDRLAALDSAAPISGETLVAETDGRLAAALSLASGQVVADPFLPTADLVALLHAGAGRLHAGWRMPPWVRGRGRRTMITA
jgi:hypothetical protein